MNRPPDSGDKAYRLDLDNQCLLRGEQRVQLTPKAFAVLEHLRHRRGTLVTKDELLAAVWPRVFVGDAVLKVAVREIRKALRDDPKTPRYIETLHRRGYRLIGDLPLISASPLPSPTPARLAAPSVAQVPPGRESAWRRLDSCWSEALQGRRQWLLAGGEPGVGKTTLVDAWLAALPPTDGSLWAKGHCLEQRGGGESYLAVLDALGRLCKGFQGARVKGLLASNAPGWLLQLPWLLEKSELAELREKLFGFTGERMLRELAVALETLTHDSPLILVFEDLHWADHATLELLDYLARRDEPARLLVVSTFRPGEIEGGHHPLADLRRELNLHGRCRELLLDSLDPEALEAYLEQRLVGPPPPELAATLYRRTGGHPLFLARAVDFLLEEQVLVKDQGDWTLTRPAQDLDIALPPGLQQVLERQMQRLDDSQRALLSVAALAGMKFTAAAVATLLEIDLLDAEDRCEEIVQGKGWLKRAEAVQWPDGTLSGAYRFVHVLYRDAWYDTLPMARRRRLHLALARRLETGWQGQHAAVAAELAGHFLHAREAGPAIDWLSRTADVDAARFAHREASARLEQAMTLLPRLEPARRRELEPALLERLNQQRLAAGRLDQVIDGCQRLAELAREQQNPALEARALLALGNALFWVDRQGCLAAADQAMARVKDLPDPLQQAQVRGWQAHWQCLIRGYSPDHEAAYRQAVTVARQAGDRIMECQHLPLLAWLLSLQSRYTEAVEAAAEGQRLARELGDGRQYLSCQFFRAWALFYAGRWGEMQTAMTEGLTLADKNGHLPWSIHFRLQQAWLRLHCFDFTGALQLCQPVAERLAHATPGSEGFLCLILMARIHLGLGSVDASRDCLERIDAWLRDKPQAMDWVLGLPWRAALAEQQAAAGDWAACRETARTLSSVADGPGERSYQVLARAWEAEAALALGDSGGAEAALAAGGTILTQGAAPMAAWRLHGAAMGVCQAAQDPSGADQARRMAMAVLNSLADSLEPGDPLRASLLEAAPMGDTQGI